MISPGLVETEFAAVTHGEARAGLFYSAADCLSTRDVVEAVLYVLAAPDNVDVSEILLRSDLVPAVVSRRA